MGDINEQFANFLLFFPVLLISVAIHEFAHCWTDDRLGDDTPRLHGRLTLNPLAHLDPIGTIMMALSAWVGFGFGGENRRRLIPTISAIPRATA